MLFFNFLAIGMSITQRKKLLLGSQGLERFFSQQSTYFADLKTLVQIAITCRKFQPYLCLPITPGQRM